MQPLTAGSNFTLQWLHSGHTSVLLYMPCKVAAQLLHNCNLHISQSACRTAQHSTTSYLKMVHNDRVIVLTVIVPGLLCPLLIWLPCIISVLHAQNASNACSWWLCVNIGRMRCASCLMCDSVARSNDRAAGSKNDL